MAILPKKIADKIKAKPKAAPEPDTLPSESEPQNLEPVYTPPPPKRMERPPLPDRFTNGGGSADEKHQWIKDNWGD